MTEIKDKDAAHRYFEVPPDAAFEKGVRTLNGEPWESCSLAQFWSTCVRDEIPTATVEDEDIFDELDIKLRGCQAGERKQLSEGAWKVLCAYWPRNDKHPNHKQWNSALLYDVRSFRQAVTRARRTKPREWLAPSANDAATEAEKDAA